VCKQDQLEIQIGGRSESGQVGQIVPNRSGWESAVLVIVNGGTNQNVLTAGRRDAKLKARVKLRDEIERCKQCWILKKLVVTSLQSWSREALVVGNAFDAGFQNTQRDELTNAGLEE
jgi:hypothetical protein